LSNANQDEITSQSRIYWLEFWQLLYWKHFCQLVVDAIQCIFEGISQLYAHEALQLTRALAAAAPDIVLEFYHPFTKLKRGKCC
jgi:hypothetical protein